MKEIAINNYIGKNGARLNCAQSIASAFNEKFNISDTDTVSKFSSCGGGNAPEGMCGAYYVSLDLINRDFFKNNESLQKEFEGSFNEKFENIKCSDLKQNKKSCLNIIEFCSNFLAKNRS